MATAVYCEVCLFHDCCSSVVSLLAVLVRSWEIGFQHCSFCNWSCRHDTTQPDQWNSYVILSAHSQLSKIMKHNPLRPLPNLHSRNMNRNQELNSLKQALSREWFCLFCSRPCKDWKASLWKPVTYLAPPISPSYRNDHLSHYWVRINAYYLLSYLFIFSISLSANTHAHCSKRWQ